MRSSKPTRRHSVTLGRVTLALVIGAAATVLIQPRQSEAEEIITGEIIIEAEALRPQVLMTEPERRVIFVNRSGRIVHVDFITRNPERHHTFQVPDRIWAVFHWPGRHPFEVHFGDPALADLQGAVEVVDNPYGGPDPRVCSGVTVMGACIER